MSIQTEQTEISREDWIAAAKQVYVEAGDTEAEATELATYLCGEEDWLSGEVQDPCEAAKDDIAGRSNAVLGTAPAAH